jgi:hypothetical protein
LNLWLGPVTAILPERVEPAALIDHNCAASFDR